MSLLLRNSSRNSSKLLFPQGQSVTGGAADGSFTNMSFSCHPSYKLGHFLKSKTMHSGNLKRGSWIDHVFPVPSLKKGNFFFTQSHCVFRQQLGKVNCVSLQIWRYFSKFLLKWLIIQQVREPRACKGTHSYSVRPLQTKASL